MLSIRVSPIIWHEVTYHKYDRENADSELGLERVRVVSDDIEIEQHQEQHHHYDDDDQEDIHNLNYSKDNNY